MARLRFGTSRRAVADQAAANTTSREASSWKIVLRLRGRRTVGAQSLNCHYTCFVRMPFNFRSRLRSLLGYGEP